MFSGECRRSPRIVELDARKARERSQKKGNVIDLDKGQEILKYRRRRKKVKVRTVQDLILNSVEYKVQKTDSTGNDEDRLVNAAIVPSGPAVPEKSKLELLLGMLQRRDTHKIFAEPVNPEEVECYYDVIKEPMDFGTIEKKLNEGSYQTLEEFEHDVFLVPNNAMLFNSSSTVYYRQAKALKELATRLFHALKTDPENFEDEVSMRRMGLGRRRKAQVNSTDKISSIGITARGYKAGRQSDDVEVEKRQTYRPLQSFLSENGSVVSAVYNSPQQLNLSENAGMGYVESLHRFTKDLGPIVHKVAMKKVETYFNEVLNVWNVNASRQFWAPRTQNPNAAAFASSNIKVAPSFKVPPTTPACQKMLGTAKLDIQSGFSNGGQASMGDTININNVFNGGTNLPGCSVQGIGDFRGKMTQSAPSMHLFGNSNLCQMFAAQAMGGSSSFWNRGKVSAVNNIDINDALKGGKGEAAAGNKMDFWLQNTRGGLGSGAALKEQSSTGIRLDSSSLDLGLGSGNGKLDITAATWNTKNSQKELSMTSMMLDAIQADNAVQTVGLQASSGTGSWMQGFAPTGTGSIGASSSSWRPPSQVLMTGLNTTSQATDQMRGILSQYPIPAAQELCQKEAVNVAGLQQGGKLIFKPVEMGLQPLTGYGLQEQTVSSEMASLVQQKGELDSLLEAPSLENWLVSYQREHAMRGSSNELEHERFRLQTQQSRGESSSGAAAAAADRRQEQPMLGMGRELPQWKFL